jgi:catechol 2,3-dioxygenase-like lactoylglutathione lyase family enzyme
MALNHVNLVVPDVPRTRAFFETYFGFHCVVERGRDALAVMRDDSGFILTLSNFDKVDAVEYPGVFHVGFFQDSPERVDEIHRHLTADGFEAESPRNFHGAWTFYIKAPGGFTVEVGHQRGIA